MYQSIGINLSKTLDAITKKVKVPAITQRDYYKDLDNIEEEYINFYKQDCNNNNIGDDDKYSYLDDTDDIDEDYCNEECNCEDSDCENSDNYILDEYNYFIDKIKNIDSKVVISAGIGALVGCVGMYFILRRK